MGYIYYLTILEADFVACFEAIVKALQLQNFITGLGIIDSIVRH